MKNIKKLIVSNRAALCSCLLVILLLTGLNNRILAQGVTSAAADKPPVPAILPGKGAAQFDFFYAGEGKSRNMYIIRVGEIAWSYIDTTGRGGISGAVLRTTGNILLPPRFGITLSIPAKTVLGN